MRYIYILRRAVVRNYVVLNDEIKFTKCIVSYFLDDTLELVVYFMFGYNYLCSFLSSVFVCEIAITKSPRNEASEKSHFI